MSGSSAAAGREVASKASAANTTKARRSKIIEEYLGEECIGKCSAGPKIIGAPGRFAEILEGGPTAEDDARADGRDEWRRGPAAWSGAARRRGADGRASPRSVHRPR